MSKRVSATTGSTLLLVVLGAALGGCVNRDKSDLENYVASVLSRKGGQIEPMPPIKPYERYLYQSAEQGLRDPFTPFIEQEQKQQEIAAAPDAAQQAYNDEILAHNREELEGFELDSLRMVGTLEDDEELWGIVRDNAGTVHRVQVGNYLGRNYGKILQIQEDRIEVREIVKDDDGRWEEREASLALAEQE
ncbi:MAG: pilus assembly protein PilP [Gammaproteobacteria bacterium]|nr:pilus assembly protein PilP [Gammaproteobacteria bacterium]